jgi:hypothetical protein
MLIVSCDSAVPVTTLPRTPDAPVEQTVAAARRSTVNELGVSMIQLIARPSDFDGEYVRVTGFYRHEFEGNLLYLHREDYEQGLTKNGVWMDGKPEHNMTYILVEGRFNAKRTGHLGLSTGEIEAVTRIVPWVKRSAPETP